MGLAELRGVPHALRRLQHHEERIGVDFEFRPLMGVMRVFDGQLVQPEALLHLLQQLRARLVQADPDEPPLAGLEGIEVIDVEIGNLVPVLIGRAADHHAVHHAAVPLFAPPLL